MSLECWYVYMVRCADDSLYTGMAKDIGKRLREHVSRGPECAKYTRSRPVPDSHAARSLEWHLKRLTRVQKVRLTQAPEEITALCESAAPLPADLNLYLNTEKMHTSD